MKITRLQVLVGIVTAFLALGPFAVRGETDDFGQRAFDMLALEVLSDQGIYELGEEIELRLRVTNLGEATVILPEDVVGVGYATVWIGFEDYELREYRGPRWGLRENSSPIRIEPGASAVTDATILYNHRIETEHLNKSVAKELSRGLIEGDYALPQAGRYHIKAILYDSKFKRTVESPLVEVIVSEPTDREAEIWGVLKRNPQYGYFIQTGRPRGDQLIRKVEGDPFSPEVEAMLIELETLVERYPRSRSVSKIKRALSDYYNSRWFLCQKKRCL